MGVQVRVAGPRLAMVEHRTYQPGGVDLGHPAPTDPGERRVLLQPADRGADRVMVSILDRGPDFRAAQGPEHRGGLHWGEHQVETGHRPTTASGLNRRNSIAFGRGRWPAVQGLKLGDPLSNTSVVRRQTRVDRVRRAQP